MFLGKHQDQGDVVDCAHIAHAAPPLRRELAHLFTLRTDCHPENKCTLALVVRSSGLILAFLNPAGDKHRSPPTRRAIANTARQHGAAVRSTGCTPYHILHTSDTHVLYTSQRRYVGVVVGTKKATGQEVRSNARRSDTWWLRDVARFGSPRVTLPRVSAKIEPSRELAPSARRRCCMCASCARVAPPLRRELAHYSLRGQNVIQRTELGAETEDGMWTQSLAVARTEVD